MNDAAFRLETVPRIRKQVAERIREAIASSRFPPGARLIERELCELMGVSRTSVREALRELESEGLVSTEGGRIAVAEISAKDALETYEVRAALESLAARLFARRATPDQMRALEEAAAHLFAVYEDFQPASFLEAKSRFYDALFAGAGNDVARGMLRTINTRASQLRVKSVSAPKRAQASIAEIRAIVDALRNRDEVLADALSRLHVENACRAALQPLDADGAD